MVVGRVRVDLATCLTSKAPPVPMSVVTVRGTKNSQSILFKGKVVLTLHERYGKDTPQGIPGPIELFGTSPDRRWILYAVDPMGSASLAADGLTLKAVAAAGGRSYTVASGLTYPSYRSWCDFRTLVVTAGGDRIASYNKRLIVTGPPSWRPRLLVHAPSRAFGSVVCAPDGNSVVVQEEPAGGVDETSTTSHWKLWRITLSGKATRLTDPPAGLSDESPQFSPDQRTLYFVRGGWLYALGVGPLLTLPYVDGYYGHHAWPYTVTR